MLSWIVWLIVFGLVQAESLPDVMKFDHGYTASSPPVRNVSI